MKVPQWLTLSFLGLPLAATGAVEARSGITANDVRQADIQLFMVKDVLTISPLVSLTKGDAFLATTLELMVEKKGPSGSVASRQAGVIEPGQTEGNAIARIQLKVTDEDAVTATLTIRSGQKILAQRQRLWPGGKSLSPH
ncbi:curli-like amyloid fiber formation chaperone CsgH [Cohaesibacter intestini]|uniref:curli-like amyloid fiber formation chaperone CsgH n=1 Tax=Cohaesibacter intestini TaxID=2211145 RepID=UPI000DEB2021|nr:curli-like amyloid fiber formation chaperone CsgH [Cohaesibacter intestini]